MTKLPASELEPWTTELRELFDLADIDINIDLILDVASDVAHSVARPAAPLSTFIMGVALARAGGGAAEAQQIADLISAAAKRSQGA